MYSSFSTNAITAQSTVLASVVFPISRSTSVLHHFLTSNSSPSLLLLVTLHPATYRYSMSQQGSRTRVESEIPLHPRMSKTFNLSDFLRILSICWSSMPSKYPLWSTPIVSSSRYGNPGEAICSLTGTSFRPNIVLVVLNLVSFGQPFCSFSMFMSIVSRDVVEMLETSSTRKFLECC